MRLLPILFSLLAGVCLSGAQTPMGKALGSSPSSCQRPVPPCDPNYPYRSHDGSCNNLAHPGWGLPGTPYSRLLPPRYADGLQKPRRAVDGGPLPSARKVRTELFHTGQIEDDQRTLVTMQWGQIVAHDMSLLMDHDEISNCCTGAGKYLANSTLDPACFPIHVPSSDPTQGQAGISCMNFTRSFTDRELGCASATKPAKQISAVTSFLDLSNIYGNSDDINRSLRTLQGGQMKSETRGNKVFPPNEPDLEGNCPCDADNETVCYKTGDSRANQSPQLAILQIILLRAHNGVAEALQGINPQWDDERLYQEARRINIAAYQHATYHEFLPALLGYDNLLDNEIIFPLGKFVNDYDKSVPPNVTNEHATGAYRQLHSQIAGQLKLINADRETQSEIPISTWLNRPQVLEIGNNLEQLTIGLVTQNAEKSDHIFVKQMSDKLFTCQGIGFGLDLRAIDIQRDRDHAMGYYNEYRKFCGLKVARSFDDYGDLISPPDIAILKRLYKSYKDVDLSVGGGLEYLAEGAQVGPTFQCILMEQFKRTRQADRFWFSNRRSGLTLEQLHVIENSSVARLFCNWGDGITKMQPNAFKVINDRNKLVPCSEIPTLDLTKWKE